MESAWGATRKKDGYFKRKYGSLIVRKGKKKALVAIAHKIIVSAYFVLKNNESYKEPLLNANNEQKHKQKQIQKQVAKLIALGFSVRLTPVA